MLVYYTHVVDSDTLNIGITIEYRTVGHTFHAPRRYGCLESPDCMFRRTLPHVGALKLCRRCATHQCAVVDPALVQDFVCVDAVADAIALK